MWSGTSFQIKFIKWSLSFGFRVDLRLPPLSFTYYMRESVGGAKQAVI